MPVIKNVDATVELAEPEHLKRGFGGFVAKLFSDDGGLTQFGAFTETLSPGARSGNAHWHENEDEFIYVIEGTLRVFEGDVETDLNVGDAATFKAGVPVGHYLKNVTSKDVTYLVVGTRAKTDVVHLTDEDAILVRGEGKRHWTDKSGQPISR